MSSFRDYTEKFKDVVPTTFSCIPKILSDDPYLYVKNLFIQCVRNDRRTTKITIIDPYITPIDISTMADLFGGYSKISLEVISKFSSKEKDFSKEERKIKLKEFATYFCKNGLFKSISFIHTQEQMHDRYIIVWEDNVAIRCLSIGGSLAQNFQDYIGIIEIKDKAFEQCLISYLSKLKDNINEIF